MIDMGSDRFRKRKQKDFFKRERMRSKRAKSSIHGEGRETRAGPRSWLLGLPVSLCRIKKGWNKEMSDFFTVNQLARYFNVNPKTIYRRLWAKEIPAFKVGRTWRIAKKDLKWLRQ